MKFVWFKVKLNNSLPFLTKLKYSFKYLNHFSSSPLYKSSYFWISFVLLILLFLYLFFDFNLLFISFLRRFESFIFLYIIRKIEINKGIALIIIINEKYKKCVGFPLRSSSVILKTLIVTLSILVSKELKNLIILA